MARPGRDFAFRTAPLVGRFDFAPTLTMPLQWRDKVPTANFFRPSGYADNPVAQRNNVVAKLLAATDAQMDQEIKKPGAQELAAALR